MARKQPPARQPGLFDAGQAASPTGKLAIDHQYVFPPFTVLNARDTNWQARKQEWLSLGIKSEVGREEDLTYQLQSFTEAKYGTTKFANMGGTSVFDPVLCELMYKWFCPPGGTILDPFAGGSVRGIVAGYLGYTYYGCELRPEQVAANREQHAAICPDAPITWVAGDSRDTLPGAPEADFVFSCPPYGNLEVYSNDAKDLSTLTYEAFLEEYAKIIALACGKLRQDRLACFVVGEYRDKRTGNYVGFVPDTTYAFARAGMALYNEAILVTPIGSLMVRTPGAMNASMKLGKSHQNVLVYVKGDPKDVARTNRYERGVVDKPRATTPREPKAAPAPQQVQAQVLSLVPPAPEGWQPTPLEPIPAGVVEVGFDTEGTGLRPWAGDLPVGLSVAYQAGGQLVSRYYPWGHAGGNLDPERCREWARQELRGKRLRVLNGKYDAHMMYAWGVDLEAQGCTLVDVGHREALLDDHRRGFKLEQIAQDRLGTGKVQGIDMTLGAHIYHAGQVAKYACTDVELPYRICDLQQPELEAQELLRVAALEEDVAWGVVGMEREGMPVDLATLAQWQGEADQEMAELQVRLNMAAGFPVNVNSPGDMEKLFHSLGLQVPARTPTGQMSLAEGALAGIKHEVVVLAQRLATLADVAARSLHAYPRQVSADGLMRYSLHQLRGDEHGTISGRFSCSQAIRHKEGANLQQVMRSSTARDMGLERFDVRKLFVAPPGRLLLSADAEQVEYRVFAHYTGSDRLAQAYRDNPRVDFHEWVGKDVRRLRPDFDRGKIKSVNFMVLFGGGIKRICAMLGVDEAVGREMLAQYDRVFPEARKLAKAAMRTAETRGWVRTYLGRRCRFINGDRAHKALNAIVQGTAADYNKAKLVVLHRARKEYDLHLRLTVHDEFVGDVPDKAAADGVAQLLDRQEWDDFRVPLLWACGTGANWSEAK